MPTMLDQLRELERLIVELGAKMGCPFKEPRDHFQPTPIDLEMDSQGANPAGADSAGPRVLGDSRETSSCNLGRYTMIEKDSTKNQVSTAPAIPTVLGTPNDGRLSEIDVPIEDSSKLQSQESSRRIYKKLNEIRVLMGRCPVEVLSDETEKPDLVHQMHEFEFSTQSTTGVDATTELESVSLVFKTPELQSAMSDEDIMAIKPCSPTDLLSEISELQSTTMEEEIIGVDPCNLLFSNTNISPTDFKVIPNSTEVIAFEGEPRQMAELIDDQIDSMEISWVDLKLNSIGILDIPLAYNVFVKMSWLVPGIDSPSLGLQYCCSACCVHISSSSLRGDVTKRLQWDPGRSCLFYEYPLPKPLEATSPYLQQQIDEYGTRFSDQWVYTCGIWIFDPGGSDKEFHFVANSEKHADKGGRLFYCWDIKCSIALLPC